MRRLILVLLCITLAGGMSLRRLLMAGGGASFPAVLVPPQGADWTRVGVILSPDVAWEETAVYEPTVLVEADDSLTMIYSGGWANPGIGRATCPAGVDSTDPDNWTRDPDNPILGQGGGGVAGIAVRQSVVKVGSTYYVFWVDANPNANLRVSSTDDFDTWTHHGIIVADDAVAWSSGWANSTVWTEGSTNYMLLEGRSGSIWEIALLSSSSLTSGWTFLNSGNPLTSLQVAAGGMYGGPTFATNANGDPTPTFGGKKHLWIHAAPGTGSLPTDIYHAELDEADWPSAPDSWTITPAGPVMTHTGSAPDVDQLADPSIIVLNGTAYLFVDADDNVSESAHIVVATAPAVTP